MTSTKTSGHAPELKVSNAFVFSGTVEIDVAGLDDVATGDVDPVEEPRLEQAGVAGAGHVT